VDNAPPLSDLFPLSEVPRRIPKGSSGKPRHLSRIHSWRADGVRGVRLQATRVGGCWYTCEAWLREFFDRLSNPNITKAADTPSRLARQHDQAERELELAGI